MSEVHNTTEHQEPDALLQTSSVAAVSIRTALVLLTFTLLFTALMAGTYLLTREPIAASEQAAKLETIGAVLPRDQYDNDLLADTLILPPTAEIGQTQPSTVYRARRKGVPVAAILEVAAADGYSGRIDLIVAVAPDGAILAARVTRHKETPGLGDYIDIAKDKNKQQPWITQFNGLGNAEVSAAEWKVRKDGGRFDQRAGATISARAVTNALGRTTRYAAAHTESLFAVPPQQVLQGDRK